MTAEIAQQEEHYTVVRLRCRELTWIQTADMQELVFHAATTLPGLTLILDMTGIDFVDTSGLGVLVGSYKRIIARSTTAAVLLISESPKVRRLLETTGLNKIFSVYATVDQAVDTLAVCS